MRKKIGPHAKHAAPGLYSETRRLLEICRNCQAYPAADVIKVPHVGVLRRDATGTRVIGKWRIVLGQVVHTQVDPDGFGDLVRGADIEDAV